MNGNKDSIEQKCPEQKSFHLKCVTNSICCRVASADVWKLDIWDAGLHCASLHCYIQGKHTYTYGLHSVCAHRGTQVSLD